MSDMWFSFRQQQLGETDWHEPEVKMTKLDEALKRYDSGATRTDIKERWSLLPMDALRAAARVMARGAETHGDRNWERGIPIDEVCDHAMNHIAKYLEGDRSEEHLAHALCNLCMAVHFHLKDEGEDS